MKRIYLTSVVYKRGKISFCGRMQKMFQLLHFLTILSVLLLYNKEKLFLKNGIMRIDKFLNSVNITKRRSVAQDMISNGVVLINGVVAKASKNVEVGGIITLNLLESVKKYQVLQIPTTKSTPKSLQNEYIRELS